MAYDFKDRKPMRGERFSVGHLSRYRRNSRGDIIMKAQNYSWENVRLFARVEAGNTLVT